MTNETSNTGTAKHPEFTDEQRLEWRMDLIVRHAGSHQITLQDAAEQFKKAEAVLAKTD